MSAASLAAAEELGLGSESEAFVGRRLISGRFRDKEADKGADKGADKEGRARIVTTSCPPLITDSLLSRGRSRCRRRFGSDY
jgi:hypothetical protein